MRSEKSLRFSGVWMPKRVMPCDVVRLCRKLDARPAPLTSAHPIRIPLCMYDVSFTACLIAIARTRLALGRQTYDRAASIPLSHFIPRLAHGCCSLMVHVGVGRLLENPLKQVEHVLGFSIMVRAFATSSFQYWISFS